MQKSMLAVLAVAAFGLAGATGAVAVPAGGTAIGALRHNADAVIQVREGCGRGHHRDAAGNCVRGCGEGWHYSHRARHCVSGPRMVPGGAGN